jgi:hypothetical protein
VALFMKDFGGQLKEMSAPPARTEVDVGAFISEMDAFLKHQFTLFV